jgi:hypothetical protein
MRRVTRFGWFLAALFVVTVVLALVAPAVSIFPAALLALALLAVLAEGIMGLGVGPDAGLFGDTSFTEPKREALAKRYKRGRPEWEKTPPDHADEHPDSAWERERRRRGLR